MEGRVLAWIALIIAVLANVIMNVSLKLAVKKVSSSSGDDLMTGFLTQPLTWIGLCAGGVLLGSYLIAIRQLGLGFCYATVTSLALVLITLSAALVLQEPLTKPSVLGLGLIMLGILVLTYVEWSK